MTSYNAKSILSVWNLRAYFMDDEKSILQGVKNASYIAAVSELFSRMLRSNMRSCCRGDAACNQELFG